LKLLLRRTGFEPAGENGRHGALIVRRFGLLALAIDQAGSYIRKQRLSPHDFIDHYNRRRKGIKQETLSHIDKYLSNEKNFLGNLNRIGYHSLGHSGVFFWQVLLWTGPI
jgi:hypothetical protein